MKLVAIILNLWSYYGSKRCISITQVFKIQDLDCVGALFTTRRGVMVMYFLIGLVFSGCFLVKCSA